MDLSKEKRGRANKGWSIRPCNILAAGPGRLGVYSGCQQRVGKLSCGSATNNYKQAFSSAAVQTFLSKHRKITDKTV
jgi:hypothetical protein